MSLMLKGIDLPKDEKKPLKIEIWSNGDIYKDYGYGYEYKEGVAIQIPKGHGRLIDRDKVLKGLEEDTREAFTKHDVWLMLSKYNANAPTILEAEE